MTETAAACQAGAEEHCITCGDEGIPVEVIELGDGAAVCTDAAGNSHHVEIDLVGPVAVGDKLLIHAGVAIAHLQAAGA
jgi:hydrogenase maturation factor